MKMQYRVTIGETIGEYQEIASGEKITNLELGSIVTARLWDGTNGGNTANLNIQDLTNPNEATITLSKQTINVGETITANVSQSDNESGTPGKIQGTIDNQKNIGTISKNTKFGIYGKVDNISSLNIDKSKEMEVALRDEIKTGKAQILCNLDNDMPQMYEVEIEKVYKENNYDNKSMQIKVTDNRLIEKTGGIIQGMSGSPILQNGKFVGAVTHVMVNNPLEGYGVFADIMLKKSKEIE